MQVTKEKNYSRFESALSDLINRFSMESGSDTPDYILAQYLTNCLKAYDQISHVRHAWYGSKDQGTLTSLEKEGYDV